MYHLAKAGNVSADVSFAAPTYCHTVYSEATHTARSGSETWTGRTREIY